MLIKLIMLPFWLLIELLIFLFPSGTSFTLEWVNSLSLIKFGLYILPNGFWSTFISVVISWLTLYYGWIIVEWIYKKIPGVD